MSNCCWRLLASTSSRVLIPLLIVIVKIPLSDVLVVLLSSLKFEGSTVGGVALRGSAEGHPLGRAPCGNAGEVKLVDLDKGQSLSLWRYPVSALRSWDWIPTGSSIAEGLLGDVLDES